MKCNKNKESRNKNEFINIFKFSDFFWPCKKY